MKFQPKPIDDEFNRTPMPLGSISVAVCGNLNQKYSEGVKEGSRGLAAKPRTPRPSTHFGSTLKTSQTTCDPFRFGFVLSVFPVVFAALKPPATLVNPCRGIGIGERTSIPVGEITDCHLKQVAMAAVKIASVKFICIVLMVCGVLDFSLQLNRLHADTIWLKGETQPKHGTVSNQADDTLQFTPFSSPNAETIKWNSIELLVINIDPQRLETLSPNDLSAYRDYAEELASQKSDPAAHELAIRLYLIAAAGGAEDLRASCLQGLISLAENQQQRIKWQTLEILTAPTLTSIPEPSPDTLISVSPEARILGLKIVRAIRRGQHTDATKLLNQSGSQAALAPWEAICSAAQLTQMAQVDRLSRSQLQQLLTLELAILSGKPADAVDTPQIESDWGGLATTNATITASLPSFRTATQFDPEESIYRSGKWVKP